MNLILIPKIDSRAYYPYLGDFTHTYNGQSFYFDFLNESDIPQDIQISSSIFDSVIQAELSMDSLRIAQQGYIISSLSNYAADISSLLVNFALSSIDAIYQGLIDSSKSILKWSVIYNGSTGTDRYSWTFSCPLGSQDITLGSDGLLPHPSDHTYTSHDDQAIADILDNQIDDDVIYIPPYVGSFNDLPAPYFNRNTLILTTLDNSNIYHTITVAGFENCFVGLQTNSSQDETITFYHPVNQTLSFTLDGSSLNISGSTVQFSIPGQVYNYSGYRYIDYTLKSINLPSLSLNAYNPSWNSSYDVKIGNLIGVFNNSLVSGTCRSLWLDARQVSPVFNPDDIVIPIDEPMPVDPIITWPDDNLPDDDPDGEPIVIDPYIPILPDPTIPDIPAIVSGNDDLWPDMNDYFDAENDLDGFLFPLRDFEFGSFANVTARFSSALAWVSTIMMTLFDGSDFNILFSILAVFFIACALLGIYKWWNS